MNWMFLIETGIKLIFWLMGVFAARDETKRRFLDMVKAMQKRSLVSAELHDEYERQLREAGVLK